MKKLFSMASFILAVGTSCYAQENVKNENDLEYSCDESIKEDFEKETITLIGNAYLKTSVFEFLNSDKIVINKVTKEILVIGEMKVNLNSGTINQLPKLEKHRLRYKIGEQVAYLE